MRSLARRHTITHHFIAQLELDIEAAGIRDVHPIEKVPGFVPKRPMNGIIGNEGHSINIEDLTGLPDRTLRAEDPEQYHENAVTSLTAMPACSRDPMFKAQPKKAWYIAGSPQQPSAVDHQSPIIPRHLSSTNTVPLPTGTFVNNDFTEFCPYNSMGQSTSPSSNAEQTPPSDSSASQTIYALRQGSGQGNPAFGRSSAVTVDTFQTPSDWTVSFSPNSFNKGHPEGDSMNSFLENQMWGLNG